MCRTRKPRAFGRAGSPPRAPGRRRCIDSASPPVRRSAPDRSRGKRGVVLALPPAQDFSQRTPSLSRSSFLFALYSAVECLTVPLSALYVFVPLLCLIVLRCTDGLAMPPE